MYKYGTWKLDSNRNIICYLEGLIFPLEDFSKETKEQVTKEVKISHSSGKIIEINEPNDDNKKKELIKEYTTIKHILEYKEYRNYDKIFFEYEYEQLKRILQY